MKTSKNHKSTTDQLTWQDNTLYGSQRLGVKSQEVQLFPDVGPGDPDGAYLAYFPAKKQYECTNHLGNVRAVIGDERQTTIDGSGNTLDGTVDLVSATDCYPFGSIMPGRSYSSNSYRFGFNGMEKDDEIHGATGTSYTTEFRQYDTRLGRWLSVDPAMKKYASWSSYVFSFDNPIWWNDPGGDDPDGDGEKRAAKAKEIDKADNRVYGHGLNTAGNARVKDYKTDNEVDCSEFAAEVQTATGYTNGGSKADVQAETFKKTGEYSTNLKDVKLGDQVFFKKSSDINHTAIVTNIFEDGEIEITHATVNGNRPGSIKTDVLNTDGSIPYWYNTFVMTGRPKIIQTTANTTNEDSQNSTNKNSANIHGPVLAPVIKQN